MYEEKGWWIDVSDHEMIIGKRNGSCVVDRERTGLRWCVGCRRVNRDGMERVYGAR